MHLMKFKQFIVIFMCFSNFYIIKLVLVPTKDFYFPKDQTLEIKVPPNYLWLGTKKGQGNF